jgi:hypothetical protein
MKTIIDLFHLADVIDALLPDSLKHPLACN